jgi:hypothetical protein
MDQLKALAQNVTQGDRASSAQSDASPVQSNMSEGEGAGDPGGSQAAEPTISVFPRPTGFENSQVINDRPKFGNQVLTLRDLSWQPDGAGSTFAWQAHLRSNDVAISAPPAPVAAAPAKSPDVSKQLEALAQGISSELAVKQQQLVAAQQQLEQLAAKQQQLAAKQEQVGQSIAKLQALEQARQRTPAPVQSRAASVPPRPSVAPPPVEPTTQPPIPPRTEAHHTAAAVP